MPQKKTNTEFRNVHDSEIWIRHQVLGVLRVQLRQLVGALSVPMVTQDRGGYNRPSTSLSGLSPLYKAPQRVLAIKS